MPVNLGVDESTPETHPGSYRRPRLGQGGTEYVESVVGSRRQLQKPATYFASRTDVGGVWGHALLQPPATPRKVNAAPCETKSTFWNTFVDLLPQDPRRHVAWCRERMPRLPQAAHVAPLPDWNRSPTW